MTALKGITPTPTQAAAAYRKVFDEVLDVAGGKDGRITKASAERIAARGDAGALVADNVLSYLEKTGQASVSASKMAEVVAAYVEREASDAAGSNQKLSLLEIRNLPQDLQTDVKHLRGKDNKTMSPAVTFDENFLYVFLQSWTSTKSLDTGTIVHDGQNVVLGGLNDIGEWQAPAEDALAGMWERALKYRSDNGAAVSLGRQGSGTMELGEAVDAETGKAGLLVQWKDIDDASFAWFYQRMNDGTYAAKKEVYLN